MNTKEYFELFRYLMEQYGLLQENIVFVENIASWCREQGIPESDKERPLKLISGGEYGCKMLIREEIPERVIGDRIKALNIRNQLRNVAFNRADMLDSIQKKLTYLFLSEYATSIPDVSDDELLSDDWVFGEMEKLGYFKI
jgi:hypothetical protein